ncbi:MAG: transposase [Oscillatoriales cyanobacterium]|uniref:RNA-guided endonuclease TnpB family protein n=1 Tax=Microcoleus anatoxicus PTRS2 TaxID=2705321 RepID=A0ABU8YVR9_9CYAN|nr:MAG: transposase [Oscillatoriales cyanobacterium]TAD94582.1 MAG: transposase [Oscillatoriales cyanobacterium]TAE02263.1 MAG: transposase [Oscillatoriales cyanobacterium]TAE99357.1 MAG: transposase [Oscillatoriales cyanobacterium]TAF34582.1 MAG: transposase [Oscillatoriales cyanobacterium]
MFALKRALKLNNNEATLMARHAGFRRVVFNFGLSLRTQMYSEGKFTDSKVINEVKKVLTNHVKKQPEFAWMNQLSSRVYQNALIDLKDAFSRYRSGKAGHPKFTTRRDGQSFTVDSSNGKVLLSAGNTIKIPTLGTFRLYEALECGYVSQTFTISKEGSRWFVSFCLDAERLPVQQSESSVGIDVGINSFATLSTEQVFDAPKPLKQAKTKLATLQRKASKQVRGSQNQRKTYHKIRRLHARIARIRDNFLHKLTTYLATTFKLIKIENLNVQGMMANHKLAGAISDLGFYEFKRQLDYKCKMYGANLVLVDQWFPSTKICSNCGTKKDMPLSVRTFDCPVCGICLDRDWNASLNILNWEPSA